MEKNTKNPKNSTSHNKGRKKKKLKKNDRFWTRNIGAKIPYTISATKLSSYLASIGFYNKTIFGQQQVIKLDECVAEIQMPMEVYSYLLDCVKEQYIEGLEECFRKQGEELILSKKGLLGTLPKLKKEKYKDTKKCVFIFYSNTILKITRKSVETVSYNYFVSLDRYVFKEQIIEREFSLSNKKKGDFRRFLKKTTDSPKHFLSTCTAIGYLLSSYKNPSIARAAIITDVLSQIQNEAYGRSGKGILIKAISNIKNVVEYNGKVADLANDKFVFQNVEESTDLIVLQDVTKGFVFESLFSTLTDTMSIERKHRSKIMIPFEESPKIALTTNYTIPQDSDSFKDRKHLVLLNNFFNARNKPEKHFKSLLFHWSEKEWGRFDNFMAECVRLFLEKGLVAYSDEKFEKQRLINSTSKEFIDLMQSTYCNLNQYFSLKKIAANVNTGGEDNVSKSRIAGKWIDEYAAHKGYQVEKRKSGGITKICFRPSPT